MSHKSRPITIVLSRAPGLLALLAAVQLAGCVAVTGTGATVDPEAVDAAAADAKADAQAKCAPGTKSTSTKPCAEDKAQK